MDLSPPLIRGTKLKYKLRETWIDFRYEQLPTFCYYCGCIGHHERICTVKKVDFEQHYLKEAQFGAWLRAGHVQLIAGGDNEGKEGENSGGSKAVLGIREVSDKRGEGEHKEGRGTVGVREPSRETSGMLNTHTEVQDTEAEILVKEGELRVTEEAQHGKDLFLHDSRMDSDLILAKDPKQISNVLPE